MNITLAKLQSIFAKKFSIPKESVIPDTSLEDLGLDSLDALEVFFDIEEEFHICIPQEREEGGHGFHKVQDIVDMIERLIKSQHPAGFLGEEKL